MARTTVNVTLRNRILFIGSIFGGLFFIYKCFIAVNSTPIFNNDAMSEYRTIELGNVKQSKVPKELCDNLYLEKYNRKCLWMLL